MLEKLTVFNPVARTMVQHVTSAKRVDALDGTRIGLFWNYKAGGDIALRRIERDLAARCPTASFSFYQGERGGSAGHLAADQARRIARECDALVGSTAD